MVFSPHISAFYYSVALLCNAKKLKSGTKILIFRFNQKSLNHFYVRKYPTAETQLLIWHNEFSKLDFKNFNELKIVYGNASIVNNNRVVFNIKGNDFRLVVSINFLQTACYVIWFGTHKEYEKMHVETIAFDTTILTDKK